MVCRHDGGHRIRLLQCSPRGVGDGRPDAFGGSFYSGG